MAAMAALEMMMDDDELLSTKEAAALCQVSEERMRVLASDGRVSATMRGHAWLFSRAELTRLLREDPRILYQNRRTAPPVTQVQRERRRATMRRINALRTRQERQEAAQKGYAGLLAKLARQADPDGTLDAEERARRTRWLYEAHMADVRARRQLGRKMTTLEERLATLSASSQRVATGGEALETLTICYGCWREYFHGRPPRQLNNVLCATHQAELDEFARELRAQS